jgi:RHS repeat-associated protein
MPYYTRKISISEFNYWVSNCSVQEIGYPSGFNGQERDDEVKGQGNHISFADYGYDSRLGRRLNIDPIIFSWQSTYCTFNNNPILFIDPTGKGAEVTTKSEKGKVTSIEVNAKVYVHGKNANEVVKLIQTDVENNLKYNSELKGIWGGSQEVPVNFNICVEMVDDDKLSQAKQDRKTDKSINIVEINETESVYLGEGNYLLSQETQQNRGNTFTHEFFHMLGFNSAEQTGDPTHFSKTEDNKPIPLMYNGTANDGILKKRVVTSKDIAGLRNQQGFHFTISPEKHASTRIIEYPNPDGPHPFVNGEKTKK